MPLVRNRHGYRLGLDPTTLNGATFVYAVSDGAAVKVGRSSTHPALRLRELQVGNPNILELLGYSVSTTEAEAHRRLAGSRIRGEWFRLSDKRVKRWIIGLDWLSPIGFSPGRGPAAGGVPSAERQ
jgi:hypothetical protein